MIANDIRFSKKRYEEADGPAKKVAREWLEQVGFQNIEENVEESKRNFREIWDLKGVFKELGEFRIEAEIKWDWGTKWFEIPFKYDTMDIPWRKREKAEVHATHHMVIGGDMKRLFLTKRENVLAAPITEKKCRNRGWELEPFYNVPIDEKSSFWFKNNKDRWYPYKDKGN